MKTEALYQVFLKCSKVFTDSRQSVPGGLFFALRGDQFDGNQYAATALAQGASFAVVDDPAVVRDERYLLVENTLTSLQDLARFHRRQFTIPVIAITGSNGKTTTKELIQAVLATHYQVHATRGNLNNHIGVPLTLLAMSKDTEVAVIEMGANHQREIDALCRIAEPTHGLITNIGKAHLEGFGGIEGVKKGKGELYAYLAETNGAAFVNVDEPFLEDLAKNVRKKIFYIQRENPDSKHPYFEVKLLAVQPRIKVAFLSENGRLIEAQSHLIGIYNFNNIKTAVTLGKYFKVPGVKIKAAVESYIPQNNRSQIIRRQRNTFVLDAYNANPSSMQEAVRAFGELNEKRKIAILGDMLELGEYSEEGHESIARLAVEQKLAQLILVGPLFKAAAEQFGALHFPDTESLKDWFAQQNFENTFFLIKGSRRIGLERLLED